MIKTDSKMNTTYYGEKNSGMLTYLEFGSIDVSNAFKRIWGMSLHQEAYDSYMLARYMRDWLCYAEVIERENPSFSDLVRAVEQTAHADVNNLMYKYAAAKTAHHEGWGDGCLRVCEPGSTLFGLIKELSACCFSDGDTTLQKYIQNGFYTGLEISDLFNRVAKVLNPDKCLNLISDTQKFYTSQGLYDVLYGYGISWQYFLRSVQDLVDYSACAQLSILSSITVNPLKTLKVKLGTGKIGTSVSLLDFSREINRNGLCVYIKQMELEKLNQSKQDDVTLDLIVAKENTVLHFFEQLEQLTFMVSESENAADKMASNWIELSHTDIASPSS